MFLRFIHALVCISSSVLFFGSVVFRCIDILPHLELGCFPFSVAIMNNVDMHICVRGFVWMCVLILLSKYRGMGIAESYIQYMFNFSRNYQNVFSSS